MYYCEAGFKHETGKSEEVQSGNGFGQALVIFGEAPKARRPGKAPFHNPASGQQHETTFSFFQFDDEQLDTTLLCLCFGAVAAVTLIDVSQRHVFSGHLLHFLVQRLDLRAVVLVGRRHGQSQQMPQRIDRDVNLAAVAFLVTVISGALSAFGYRGQSAAVQNSGAGAGSRSFRTRNAKRRSCTSASNTPALIQRCVC